MASEPTPPLVGRSATRPRQPVGGRTHPPSSTQPHRAARRGAAPDRTANHSAESTTTQDPQAVSIRTAEVAPSATRPRQATGPRPHPPSPAEPHPRRAAPHSMMLRAVRCRAAPHRGNHSAQLTTMQVPHAVSIRASRGGAQRHEAETARRRAHSPAQLNPTAPHRAARRPAVPPADQHSAAVDRPHREPLGGVHHNAGPQPDSIRASRGGAQRHEADADDPPAHSPAQHKPTAPRGTAPTPAVNHSALFASTQDHAPSASRRAEVARSATRPRRTSTGRTHLSSPSHNTWRRTAPRLQSHSAPVHPTQDPQAVSIRASEVAPSATRPRQHVGGRTRAQLNPTAPRGAARRRGGAAARHPTAPRTTQRSPPQRRTHRPSASGPPRWRAAPRGLDGPADGWPRWRLALRGWRWVGRLAGLAAGWRARGVRRVGRRRRRGLLGLFRLFVCLGLGGPGLWRCRPGGGLGVGARRCRLRGV
jgi:hypothetical protein